MLRFEVKGSAATPYKVTFEGSGPAMRAFCTCPGGSRGGKFCKHAAAILNGSFDKLVGGAEALPELARRSTGSPLRALAATFVPSRPKDVRATGLTNLPEVADAYREQLSTRGLVCIVEGGPRESITLKIGQPFKNGGVRKAGQIVLSYEPWTAELVVNEAGEWTEILKPSVKLWRLSAPKSRAFTTLDRALAALDERLDAE